MTTEMANEKNDFVREVIINYRGPRRKRPSFTGAESVTTFLRDFLIDNSREHFIALFLDGVNQVIGYSITSIGTQSIFWRYG